MWWHAFIIPALMRLRQEDLKFEASLGYTARCYLEEQKQTTNNNKKEAAYMTDAIMSRRCLQAAP
jgi:hypothetical protein